MAKRMTKREKKERARIKKELQKKGFLPHYKKPLNRERFIKEAEDEWNDRPHPFALVWSDWLLQAIGYMMLHKERKSERPSMEAIAAAKVLRLAVRLVEFETNLKERGITEYKINELYDYIKDIYEA